MSSKNSTDEKPMTTNPNGKGAGQQYTVEGSIPSVVFRLRERARIRRQISTRKSVQEGKPDRISDLLEEAANELENCHRRLRV